MIAAIPDFRFFARLAAGIACWALLLCLPSAYAGGSTTACNETGALAEQALHCIHGQQKFKDCSECPEMMIVPAGVFMLGSPPSELSRTAAEAPQHLVTISKPFAVGKYEITFSEWDACVADGGCAHNPRDSGWGRGRRPVINVSWDDVTNEYLPWLSRTAGKTYRLLTEAEWEYAARAGTTGPFSTGETISPIVANFDGTSTYGGGTKGQYRQRTVEVGSFPANAFGLHDMHGNVWEWTSDCFVDILSGAPSDGGHAAETPNCPRVMRGGSWIDAPRVLRSAYRSLAPANTRFIYRGFRVARAL